jgi:hypothetical protein
MTNQEAICIRIKQVLKPGMVITHTRCMDFLEEHVFYHWDGIWIVAIETRDTGLIEGTQGVGMYNEHTVTNDIHPNSITHINRIPVEIFIDKASGAFDPKRRAFRYMF